MATGAITGATSGTSQVETATTVAGAGATSSGNLAVTVTADGVTGSPLAFSVALVNGVDTTATLIAAKIRTAFNASAALVAVYTVGVAGALSEFDGDMVVKLDSDMLVGRAFWLEGPTLFQRANGFYVGAYAIPPRVLAGVWRSIANTPNTGPHEAIAICFRAAAIMHGFEIPFRHEHLPAGRLLPEDFTCI